MGVQTAFRWPKICLPRADIDLFRWAVVACDQYTSEPDYWRRNRERLRYATFREQGLPIGSGAVESSVRRVINLRLKGASITWTEEHAEGVLHLRAHAKSGRWRELEVIVLNNTGWRPTARRPRAAAA